MDFLSFSFAGFGALVFAGWWILPGSARPWLLAAANLVFAYGFGSRTLVCLLLVCLAGYACGLLLEKRQSPAILWVGILCCLVPLAAYKYLPLAVPSAFAELAAPVGLSFYGFKTIAGLTDVYRRRRPAEKNLLLYFAWLGFFAQLTSGPIQRAEELFPQLKQPARFDRALAYTGCVRLCWGLFLKRCLADQFALYQGALAYKPERYYGLAIVWSVLGYGLYLYFDFASYSQLSIGVANLLGLRVGENFLSPYFSRSIGEFWRRWHISLSSFLRDYIYIPLGGSRCGKLRRYFNLMVTFLVSGLWHGASWSFAVWGGLHGLYQIIGYELKGVKARINEKLHTKTEAFSYRLGQVLVTFGLTAFAWIFFRAPSIGDALGYIRRMVTKPDLWSFFNGELYNLGLDRPEMNVLLVSLAVLFLTDLVRYRKGQLPDAFLAGQNLWFRWAVLLGLIGAVAIFGVYGPGYEASQFIYFQF